MSTARPDTWMPLYIGDYLADTMHLSTEEHGAYMLLLMAAWKNGGALPDDDKMLAAIVRLPMKRWLAVRGAVLGFFHAHEGCLHQKRLDAEIERAKRLREVRAEAGKRGGRPKATDKQTESKYEHFTEANTEAKKTPSPSPSQVEDSEPSGSSRCAALADLAGPPDKLLFSAGLDFLSRTYGKPPAQFRPVVGKWLQAAKNNHEIVWSALADIEARSLADPVAAMSARFPPLGKKTGIMQAIDNLEREYAE